jgi:bifunctional non-homologous end joining protein LigD
MLAPSMPHDARGVPMARTSKRETLAIDGHEVRLTSLDKVMYPEGFTKRDVVGYYRAVAGAILKQLHNRVVTQIRFPDGVEGDRFYQKNASRYTPDWIRTFVIPASPGSDKPSKLVTWPVIDDEAGLLWFANQGALELHTPQWHVGPRGGVGKPDRLVFDLDPGEGVDLDAVAAIARLVRDRLAEDGYEAFPVTSGGKGIHLYAPVSGKAWRVTHRYAEAFAKALAEAQPERIVAVQAKEQRVGRVMLDWSQNHPAKSTATPYTLRGKGGSPTVAAPREWDEIVDGLAQLSPDEVVARLERDGDLMARHGLA